MSGHFGDSADTLRGRVILCLAGVLLLFPSSASVLCISPGGHVAVEDITAICCTHSSLFASTSLPSNQGFGPESECQDCQDIFMTPSARSGLSNSKSNSNPFAGPLTNDCPSVHLPAAESHSTLRVGAVNQLEVPVPDSSSVPMRC